MQNLETKAKTPYEKACEKNAEKNKQIVEDIVRTKDPQILQKVRVRDRATGFICGALVASAIYVTGFFLTSQVFSYFKKEKKNQLRVENVIRGKAPETFYEKNGKRFYLKIDGKPVEDYFKPKVQKGY